ncbi:hypothetical protein EB796_018305 [Bugula neritina]|uniref:D-isomer specific 2-hydroxyacid dehydrogenase NAD-binding domain-containing protein n=1 Tax=Bugula neritina TaxID=10212 RepID=A0A7J7JDD6_BUGNE|nr:hypothetical protein EB796_018305 [Bugula neritina]
MLFVIILSLFPVNNSQLSKLRLACLYTGCLKKWIRAAILDVFSTEPLPVDSLLWKHPQVTVTPHVAAVTMPHQVAEVIAENLHNYANDRPLNYLIDWNKGY